jgi:hypothetical protein
MSSLRSHSNQKNPESLSPRGEHQKLGQHGQDRMITRKLAAVSQAEPLHLSHDCAADSPLSEPSLAQSAERTIGDASGRAQHDLSPLETRLSNIDSFEQAVVIDAEGQLIASLGADTEGLQKLAVTLCAVSSLARSIADSGNGGSSELNCSGRTLFGLHAGELFALVVPTRRSMTKGKLHAIRSLLISAVDGKGEL